ncbi:MAG TPA: BrnT family toxin [Fibrobacteria bacterium]|nr:BrnT family toxin [Fibrobacteria bacterium]
MVNYPYSFEWDHEKDRENLAKHRVDFAVAQVAFLDPRRIVLKDARHSREGETRYFCLGQVEGREEDL